MLLLPDFSLQVTECDQTLRFGKQIASFMCLLNGFPRGLFSLRNLTLVYVVVDQ